MKAFVYGLLTFKAFLVLKFKGDLSLLVDIKLLIY